MAIIYSGEFGANGWGGYTPTADDEDDRMCNGCLENINECVCQDCSDIDEQGNPNGDQIREMINENRAAMGLEEIEF